MAWVEAPISYIIHGGMEPGESDTWRLSANMFGAWSHAPSGRQDMVLTVRVTKLEGADGQPIFPECFTDADAEAVRTATKNADAASERPVAAKLRAWEKRRTVRRNEEQRIQVVHEIEELERVEAELAAFKLKSVKYVKPDRAFSDRELQVSVTNDTPHTVLYANYAVRIHSPGREVSWAEETTLFIFAGGLLAGETVT